MHHVYRQMMEEGARLMARRAYIMIQADAPYTNADAHTHDVLEVSYVNCEHCNYYINNKMYVLNRHDMIVVNSSLPHTLEWVSTDFRPLYGVAFDRRVGGERFMTFGDMLRGSSSLLQFFEDFEDIAIIPGAQELYRLLSNLTDEMWNNDDIGYQNVLLNKLLVDIARLYQGASPALEHHVDRVRRYIDKNYHSITSMEDIAGAVGLNKNHIQRLFKKQTGGTVWQYLTNVRMRSAAALLKDSDIPIGEVDTRVGIQSRQNFYLLFKKAFGISPQDYRRLTRKPQPPQGGSH